MVKIRQSFFYKHREFMTLPFAWIIWYLGNGYFVKNHPGIALHDSGVFEAVFLATVCLFTGLALIWFALKVFLREIYNELDQFTERFKDLTVWQRLLFSLCVFLGYLIAWVQLIRAFV